MRQLEASRNLIETHPPEGQFLGRFSCAEQVACGLLIE